LVCDQELVLQLFGGLYGPLERDEIGLLQLAVLQSEHEGFVWPASPSPLAREIVVEVLGLIGKLILYDAW
jgi:hypothetical protein